MAELYLTTGERRYLDQLLSLKPEIVIAISTVRLDVWPQSSAGCGTRVSCAM